MWMRVAAITALILVATPALSANGADTGSTQPPSQTAKAKLICLEETQVGTRLGTHKVCLTADQWRQQNRDAADILRKGTTFGVVNQPRGK